MCICLSACCPIHLSVQLSVHPCIYLAAYLFFCHSIHPSIPPSLPVYLYLLVCHFVPVSIRPSIHPPICPSICPSIPLHTPASSVHLSLTFLLSYPRPAEICSPRGPREAPPGLSCPPPHFPPPPWTCPKVPPSPLTPHRVLWWVVCPTGHPPVPQSCSVQGPQGTGEAPVRALGAVVGTGLVAAVPLWQSVPAC